MLTILACTLYALKSRYLVVSIKGAYHAERSAPWCFIITRSERAKRAHSLIVAWLHTRLTIISKVYIHVATVCHLAMHINLMIHTIIQIKLPEYVALDSDIVLRTEVALTCIVHDTSVVYNKKCSTIVVVLVRMRITHPGSAPH